MTFVKFFLVFFFEGFPYSSKKLWVVVNLLLDHVGLPQVVIVAVHMVIFCWMGIGDHPETFLLFF